MNYCNRMESIFDKHQTNYWQDHANLRRYNHPVVRSFAERRVAHIARLIDKNHFETCLDVGCGDGFGMFYMRSIIPVVYGCDRSALMLRINPVDRRCLAQADAYHLPYQDAQFDVVYCWELLHHVAMPCAIIAEMRRVAKSAIILCEPNAFNPAMALFAVLNKEERGSLRFNRNYLLRLLVEGGLQRCSCQATAWHTPNRTPLWFSKMTSLLPYKVPIVGMYAIAIGFKTSLS